MKFVGVIPARLASTRMPEKVLRPLNGRPMIFHVWQRACRAASLDEVIVACDDKRVFDCVRDFGGEAVMTRAGHPNGTSRAAEVIAERDADVVVNIQGDEPLIEPGNIELIAAAFGESPGEDVVTLSVRKTDRADYEDPNVVKLVTDEQGYALYFSRAPIPWYRDADGGEFYYFKHPGIYGYRKSFLLDFVKSAPARLEEVEKLEQLRILARGSKIKVVETVHDSLGVDTEEDLRAAERKLKEAV